MKKGKSVGSNFTPAQKRARAKWRRAQEYETKLWDALRTMGPIDRAKAHKRLDDLLNTVERMRAAAKAEFPDVDESFTIASMVITL